MRRLVGRRMEPILGYIYIYIENRRIKKEFTRLWVKLLQERLKQDDVVLIITRGLNA